VSAYPSATEAGRSSAERTVTAAALRECLSALTRLMAPIAPFIADDVWTMLRDRGALAGQPESVHLAGWPGRSAAPANEQHAGDVESS
jgi:isoleucyl-tRNA synthetase